MKKIIALMVLVIPIYLAGLGIKWMRDALFGVLVPELHYIWLQFVIGFVLMVLGVSFVGGYILHIEKKSKRAQQKFRK
ncbi:DUF2627 domain-containing protein [Macrococcoides canis]|uniref:DUF2627 domain-containing protein n=1 Tax=Macrococcoides canis TaxID=1855823 RepID=A0A4R6C7R9_9STAP|nr:DUF2627 domain-containing protein [Macrococcus canis]MEE1107715.1 DUF2627 domain-containing protein [Macrococcus canis]TDM18357.1 DUF2627 domain-containing protein [Macrococcus canis]TDM21598.1 DUF2627 domain-containing protein [Macrococcus canis]TDM23531.1 DUF2627 domain-containing protein [Macrococcus canis]TDM31738.1 DUF2627 domain-containing protein [Macrococcus canis]